MKKTKIVASLGPASNDEDVIMEMAKEGVDVFRINLSHASFEETDNFIKKIRSVEKKLNKVLGIMLDLDGPGIRLDKLNEDKVFLDKDRELRIYDYHVVCNNTQLSTNFSDFSGAVRLDDILILSNGDVKLKVIDINPMEVTDILIENGNEHMSIISKIENEFAFDNLEEILKLSDGVMVGRGDLGINVPLPKLPFYQKRIMEQANNYQKIGLVATDFLKTMMKEKNPSRAEVADIYNAVLDKADGLVLCDETTIGENPIDSIKVMSEIINEAEEDFPYHENLEETFKQGKQDVTSTISYSVVDSGLLLNASCILANTMSGYTARKISYFRPKSPILGLSPNLNTVRSLTLNYGVIPVKVNKFKTTDEIVDGCIQKYKEVMDYQVGDTVIITGGLPLNNKNTDFMKIEKIAE